MFRLMVLLVVLGVAHGVPVLESSALDGRIVGGHNTNIALHPWQVSLQFRNSHFCGAILIASNWVLTAAHCITEGFSTNLSIRAGSTTRSSGGQSIAVSRIILHAGWNRNINMDNDIAALQLASPVTVATARVTTLPAAGAAVASGATLSVTGWGAIREEGQNPEILQEVQVPVISRAQCINAYSAHEVTNNMVCAGFLAQGGKDSCQGDSGGPATVNNVVVGMVSWGHGCARPNKPGVYVKLSQYRNWIRQASGV